MTLFFSLYFLLPADEKAVLIEICGQSKKSKSYYASNFDKNESACCFWLGSGLQIFFKIGGPK